MLSSLPSGFLALALALVMAAPPAATAAETITLRSGATLHGVASMDGDIVVVSIGESEVRVPLELIASIATAPPAAAAHRAAVGRSVADPAARATELLLVALEGKLHDPASGSSLGLLTEAHQLSPADPRIAYWYASELLDRGHGRAASDVLEKSREAIADAYPALSRTLSERVERRLSFEELPAALVERVDAINVAAPTPRPDAARETPMHAYFRVVDQSGKPLGRDEFRVSVSGSDEVLEEFPHGYYLFRYNRGSGSRPYPCKLSLQGADLKPGEHEFFADPWSVKDAGTFTAARFTAKDRRELSVRVTDAQGRPVAGASVSARRLNVSSADSQQQVTNDDGAATLEVYPGAYSVQATGSGFRPGNQQVEVSAGRAATATIKLHQAITALLRIDWRNQATDDNPGAVSGQEEVVLDEGAQPRVPPHLQWIGLTQVDDKLALTVGNRMYGYGRPGPSPTWIRVVPPADDAPDATPAERYQSIELEDIHSWQGKGRQPKSLSPRGYPNNALASYQVSPDDVLVGVTAWRDPTNGQFYERSFKAIVEESE